MTKHESYEWELFGVLAGLWSLLAMSVGLPWFAAILVGVCGTLLIAAGINWLAGGR